MQAISQTIFRKRAPAAQPTSKAVAAVVNEDDDAGDDFIDGIDDEFDDVAIDDELGDDFDADATTAADDDTPVPEDDDYRVLKRSSVPHFEDLEDEEDDVVVTDERGRRRRTQHPATVIVREFETQVTEKGTSFLKVLATLQKLSIHDRPRSMEHVIRIAEKLPSITLRQRMRMRYTLIAQHIMHYRYAKAFSLMQAVEDLTAIDASLSAVIVLLLTRRTDEANLFAIQMDHLMRAGNCSFSSHALNALLVIYTNKGDIDQANYTHARLVGDDLPIDYDAMGGYLRMLCTRAPEAALAQAYRARRDGLEFGDVIYEALVCACLELNQVQRAVALFDEGVRLRVRHTAVTIEKLIRVFAMLSDDVHVDVFVAWLKASDKSGAEPANEWVIRRALSRGRVDAAVELTRRAVDTKAPVARQTFADLTSLLLAVDQRRTAQTLLRELAPKLGAEVGCLEHSVKLIASAFGPKWGESVDWLHEMRDLGVRVPKAAFSIAISSLKNNVDESRAFVAQMREQVGVVAPHYAAALQNCVGDCDATVQLFREMLDNDGLMPDAVALNALAKAYVDAGRRRDAVRAVVSTIKTVKNLSDLSFVPLISKGPPGNKLTRAEFQLDARGQPSLAWALSFLHEHQPAVERTIELQVRLGELAAEQREYDFILSQVVDVEGAFADDTLIYYETVMKALLAKHQKGTDAIDDSVKRAELAVQLFERAHKLALVRSLFTPWMPVVRRLSAFRDGGLDQPPRPLPYVHSGALRDVVQGVIERPVINFMPKSTGLWILALRACEKAGLSSKRAAIAADWERIEPLVLKPMIGKRL